MLEQASKKEPSYADFLAELLGCEVDARRSRYLRARLPLAHLPFVKDVRSIRLRLSALDRRTADSGAALVAVHSRGQQCRSSGAVRA
jgi:hypothetical protein